MKYFVISDVHGEFYKMLDALLKAGFEAGNSNHCLISLGDNFDRGMFSKEIYDYLRKLPNKVLLRGNHEDILLKAFARKNLTYTDYYNGVGRTILSLAGEDNGENPVTQAVKNNRGIIKWIKSMPFYLETKTHILTHGWLPQDWFYHDVKPSLMNYTNSQWIEATWAHTENELARFHYAKQYNQIKPYALEKTLVVGHWHSYRLKEYFQGKNFFRYMETNVPSDAEAYTLYYDEEVPVIGVDGCSNVSGGKVNVYVFEE